MSYKTNGGISCQIVYYIGIACLTNHRFKSAHLFTIEKLSCCDMKWFLPPPLADRHPPHHGGNYDPDDLWRLKYLHRWTLFVASGPAYCYWFHSNCSGHSGSLWSREGECDVDQPGKDNEQPFFEIKLMISFSFAVWCLPVPGLHPGGVGSYCRLRDAVPG